MTTTVSPSGAGWRLCVFHKDGSLLATRFARVRDRAAAERAAASLALSFGAPR